METRWAKQLGVSQAPVREAIRELEAMGYVETIPYQGSIVRVITKEEILQGNRIRVELDKIGVEEACEKITEEELKNLREILDEMEAAADADNMSDYISLNVKFHQAVIAASGSPVLVRLWDQCNFEEWIFSSTDRMRQDLPKLARRHEILYNALANRDKELALKESRKHVEELGEQLKDLPGGE